MVADLSNPSINGKTPYGYQQEAFVNFCNWYDDPQDPEALITLTVGLGKTFTAALCAKQVLATEDDNQVLWITHRDEILNSTVQELELNTGATCMVEKGDRRAESHAQIVVASIQSLHKRRLEKLAKWLRPKLIVCDEAHHALAKTWMAAKQAFPGVKVLNLTATPYRADISQQLNLGRVLARKSTADGIRMGVLVPPRPVATMKIALNKVAIDKGDFETGSLAKLLSRPDILAESCACVDKHLRGHKGIIFAANVAHGQLLTAGLRARGLRIEEVYGDTPTELRQVYYAQLKAGEIDAIVNNLVLTEGFNLPEIDFVALFRPTKQASLYLQCLGRGLRAAPGKTECLVIDVVDVAKKKTHAQAALLPTVEDQKKFSAKRGFRCPAALVFLSWFFKTEEVFKVASGALATAGMQRLRRAETLYCEAMGKDPGRLYDRDWQAIERLRPIYSKIWSATADDPEGYTGLLREFRCGSDEAFILMMKHRGWLYCPHEDFVRRAGGGGGGAEDGEAALNLSAIFKDEPTLQNFVTDILDTPDFVAGSFYEVFTVGGATTFWNVTPDPHLMTHFVSVDATREPPSPGRIFLRTFDGRYFLWRAETDDLESLPETEVRKRLPAFAKQSAWGEQPMSEKQAASVTKLLGLSPAEVGKLKINSRGASAIISATRKLPLLRDIYSRLPEPAVKDALSLV